MRADEALKASKDRRIYLDGKRAILGVVGTIIWYDDHGVIGLINIKDLFSDKWEPCKPKDKKLEEKAEEALETATKSIELIFTFFDMSELLPVPPSSMPPVEQKCEACMEADRLLRKVNDGTLMYHLRQFHCTCKK